METDFQQIEGLRRSRWRTGALRSYSSRMSKDNNRALFDDRVASVLKLQGFTVPETPRSIYSVEKLYKALGKFSPTQSYSPTWSDDLCYGYDFAATCFSKATGKAILKALPLDVETVKLITSNPTGSAGLTLYGKDKKEAQDIALEKSKLILSRKRAPEPCLAFKRTQFAGKTRLVWGFPYSMTILEGLLAYPLIQQFKNGKTPLAFAMPTGVLGTKLRVASYTQKYAYSLDMSSFDSSVPQTLIRSAFKIISTWFDLEQEVYDGWKVRDVLDRVMHYFIFTPIVMPNLMLYRGKAHGVPSGSFFTQLVDSIVNTMLAGAISHHYGLRLKENNLFVLGDDLLFWCNKKVSLEAISSFVKKLTGMKVHGSEKSKIFTAHQQIHFLGRNWDHGVPDLPIPEIAQRMLYPETYRSYDKDVDKAKKQVKLLFLSMAATYRSGWEIVQNAYGMVDSYVQSIQSIECDVYNGTGSERELQSISNYLSGYIRYKMKYFPSKGGVGATTTADLFWT